MMLHKNGGAEGHREVVLCLRKRGTIMKSLEKMTGNIFILEFDHKSLLVALIVLFVAQEIFGMIKQIQFEFFLV